MEFEEAPDDGETPAELLAAAFERLQALDERLERLIARRKLAAKDSRRRGDNSAERRLGDLIQRAHHYNALSDEQKREHIAAMCGRW